MGLGSIFSAIFGSLWQAILGKFGMSTEQKLGRAEVTSVQQAETIKTVEQSHAQDIKLAATSDDDLRLRTKKFERPDS